MSIKELEQRLKEASAEIKMLKDMNSQLIKERDESEIEIQNVITKNSQLKTELVSLDIQMQDVSSERDNLNEIVDCHKKCDTLLEGAQYKITQLQKQCNEQLLKIDYLNGKINPIKEDQNTLTQFDKICLKGRNKIKKYMRIKNIIKKSKRYINKHKYSKMCTTLREEKVKLKEDLKYCTYKLEEYEEEYEYSSDTIRRLENDLKNLSYKYCLTQREIKEHIAANNELLGLGPGKENKDEPTAVGIRAENKKKSPSRSQNNTQKLTYNSMQALEQATEENVREPKAASTVQSKQGVINNTQVFCDSMGKGLGEIFNNHVDGMVVNNCMPNVHYNQLIKKVIASNYESGTNIVILVGNSYGVTKLDLVKVKVKSQK